MIVSVASRKASPGVTSLTAWLAAYWHEVDALRVIIEADPSGGSLAARWSKAHDVSWDPGLLTLSVSRGRLDAETLPTLTQMVADDLAVAAAPPSPDQVSAALTRLGDRGAAELASAPWVRAFVDCGRLTASSPAMVLARRAALTILACRPRLDEVHALMPAVTELAEAGCTLGLVCVGEGPYSPTEIARAARIELLGAIPEDHRAAAEFDESGLAAGRAFRRSRLAAAVAELAGLVRSRCAPSLQAQPALTPEPVTRPRAAPGPAFAPRPGHGPVTEVELVPDHPPVAAPQRRPLRAPSVSADEAELALPISLAVRTVRASAAEARSAGTPPEETPGERQGWPRLGRRDRPDRSSGRG